MATKLLAWCAERWALARPKGETEYPTARWCDQVEREINDQIVQGGPRGRN